MALVKDRLRSLVLSCPLASMACSTVRLPSQCTKPEHRRAVFGPMFCILIGSFSRNPAERQVYEDEVGLDTRANVPQIHPGFCTYNAHRKQQAIMPPRIETMTEEQVTKRRKIERTSQRNSRAKTKARIRELEQVVELFQSSHTDERLESTVSMLKQQQEHGRQLRLMLREIHRLLNEGEKLWLDTMPDTGAKQQELEMPAHVMPTQDQPAVRPTSDLEALPNSSLGQCVLDNSAGIAASPKSVPVWRSVDIALERAVQHLCQQKRSSRERDVDIAIRAIVDGWSNVKATHSLDVGWLTLKELDQTLFCDCSPPTRLAILQAMRLNMLVSGL